MFSRQFTRGLAHISTVYAVGFKLPLVSAIVGLSSRVLLWGMSLQAVKKMRLRGTQAVPAHDVISGAALSAIMDEGWHEMVALQDDVRRKHVMWALVQTSSQSDRQPSTFSRQSFFEFTCGVYKDVYPEEANKHKSIVLFAKVVKERPAMATKGAERHEHIHMITYCSKRHYWRPIKRRAMELGVRLNVS